MKAVLVDKNTNQIIKEGEYPRADMGPVTGLDDHLEWYVVVEDEVPYFDPLVYIEERTKATTTEPHPNYPHLKQYRIMKTIVKRDIDDIKRKLERVESRKNGIIVGNDFNKLVFMGVVVALRNIPNTELSNREKQIKQRVLGLASKLLQNDNNVQDKLQRIMNDENVDTGEGWIVD